MIRYDFNSYNPATIVNYDEETTLLKNKIMNQKTMIDWLDINKCISDYELNKIIETANNIRNNYDTFVVIGIGGSYLGAKAVIDCFSPYFNHFGPEIIFAGNSLSSEYHYELLSYLENKNFAVNVVSKSGDTLETSICFELIMDLLKKKYSEEEIRKRLIITTDPENGTLRKLVNENYCESFSIPSNIGGRFSVLTACGLFPIAVSGIDIKELLNGAKNCNHENAYYYALLRDYLYKRGKLVESFTVYEPKLIYFTEWLKQLFAETQGKDNKGILPVSAINTRDLHSLGQYYQEGSRILFETVINIKESKELIIKKFNMDLNSINEIALHSVAKAHLDDNTYSNIIELDSLSLSNVGELIYFFELSSALGAYILDVNPFDQPGVNKYKEIINKSLEVSND